MFWANLLTMPADPTCWVLRAGLVFRSMWASTSRMGSGQAAGECLHIWIWPSGLLSEEKYEIKHTQLIHGAMETKNLGVPYSRQTVLLHDVLTLYACSVYVHNPLQESSSFYRALMRAIWSVDVQDHLTRLRAVVVMALVHSLTTSAQANTEHKDTQRLFMWLSSAFVLRSPLAPHTAVDIYMDVYLSTRLNNYYINT